MNRFKGIVDDKFEIVIKEFQGIIGFGYIILILLGMIFESIYYGQFGINIFNYSGILDFLLVPFRRPLVLGILFGVFIFMYLYFFVLYNFLQKKHPKFHKRFYGRFSEKENFLKSKIIMLLAFYLLITISWAFVTSKKDKELLFEHNVNIRIEYDTKGEKFIDGKMIGKNEINVFLLNNTNEVQIIPLNSNIIKIRPL